MSETDDTDVLLLIPPNFFLVHTSGSEDSLLDSSRTVVHKPPSCTAQVLGKLVGQVHSLETRLESLEISTTITDTSYGTLPRLKNSETESFESRSLDRKCFTFPRRRRRKTRRERSHDLTLTSFDSVGTLKNIPRLKLKDFEVASIESKPSEVNDSPSMDGDISSITSTPSKKNDKLLLHEIDDFLTKVESYESPESKFKDQESRLCPENVIKATGDYISCNLDSRSCGDEVKLPSGRVVSSNVLDKYIYLVKSNPGSSSQSEKALPSTSCRKTQQNNEFTVNRPSESLKASEVTKFSQDKSPTIRRLNFPESKDVQPTSTPKRQASTYLDSFRPSSNKIYDRASKVLEQYKSQNYSHNTQNSMTDSSFLLAKEEFKMPQMRPFVPESKDGLKLQTKLMQSIDSDLLSLSDLWGERGDIGGKGERGERSDGKLEEEKLKREHCEAMIQELQKKILDQQEKLAVALKVDRAKDSAIAKLREAWLRLTGSLDRAEERHRAALERMVREVDNFRVVAEDAQKKTNHFEAELYKALDLAHDYQDKCKHLTTESKQLQETTDRALAAKDAVISSKDKEVEVLKENYETVMRLNKQSTDCVKNLEDALEKERSEHELTKNKVTELNRKLQSMGDEALLASQEREVLREKVNEERARGNTLERQLCDARERDSETGKRCETLESEVKGLRKQLELQKTELKSHYQKQLEEAVMGKLQEFQQQLDLAEREMEQDARGKEGAVLEACNQQMARIEEQHKLEVNLLEEKQREEIKLYRLQLAQACERIGLLENKLDGYRRRRGQIASQLHGVMEAQWRQALLILTSGHSAAQGANSSIEYSRAGPTPEAQDYAPPKIPPLTLPAREPGAGPRPRARSGAAPARGLRPDGGDAFNFEALSDNELQQYVKLLLTKPPNLDGSGDGLCPGAPPPRRERDEEPTSDRPDHEHREKARRSLNTGKPPWKA